jgi:hypothetical protein
MNRPEDPLSSLRTHDMDARAAERLLRRMRAVARVEDRRRTHPRSAWLSLWYHRAVEPALLVGLGFVYLVWTVHGTIAVLGM